MKIGDLNQHCGNCGLISYCGESWGYCLCHDPRFSAVEDETYEKIAEKAKTTPYEECIGCEKPDECTDCINREDARDHYCEQIADYVEATLKGG